ncbi:hypothetical protein D3C72_2240710 [compost metagenome]
MLESGTWTLPPSTANVLPVIASRSLVPSLKAELTSRATVCGSCPAFSTTATFDWPDSRTKAKSR